MEFRRETAREREGRRGTCSPSSFLPRPSCFSRAQSYLSLPFGTLATQATLTLKQWEKNGMLVLVTLGFLSDLPITLMASLLYFSFISVVVCFNVWSKLSIKGNVLLNSMYKSCPVFVLTTKTEFRMPVQSLNIDLSNAAIWRLSCRVRLWRKTNRVPGVSYLRK